MHVRTTVLTACLGLATLFVPGSARAQYQVTNLVSNQENAAKTTDPLIVNAWGLTYGPGGPFWISDNGAGWSTLYSNAGTKIPLDVFIPTAGGDGPGTPTGIAFNGSQDFKIKGSPAVFIFATLDGTISGWAPSVNHDAAIIAVTTPGASYTGLAISAKTSGNVLLATDNANNKVDIYNAEFKLVKSFTDTTLPAGFSAFGIQDFNGLVYVAFASSSGAAGGFIDIYSEDGTFLKQLASGAPLNQPWGFAVAPKNFGEFSNTLLVSNNTNTGTINAFNAITGQFVGTLKDVNGDVIRIDQLWGIKFGDGTGSNGATNQLFFTAGPDNNFAGTFGVITAK
ncbi:MAG: TIGR03118 family protein [Candidatus Acidiferrales bacterium]